MIGGFFLAIALRAKLLALVTLLAFFLGEKLAEFTQIERASEYLHALVATLSQKLNRSSRTPSTRLYRGITVVAVLVLPALLAGIPLSGHGAFLRILTVVLLMILLGRGFGTATLYERWQSAKEGHLMLEDDDKLFGDTHGVLRYLIQNSAEHFADRVVGAGFWFVIGGFPLMFAYLALALVNTHYATGRAEDRPFGWAAESLYGLADAPPRFLASLLLIAAGFFVPRTRPFMALQYFTAHAEKWYGLVAALLGISLGGMVRRASGEVNLPWLGGGTAQLETSHLTRWLAVLATTTLLWLILLALPSYFIIS